MASSEQQFTGPDGKPWTPPTTEELLTRGAAAVKREYLRPLKPISVEATTAPAAASAANGTTPGVRGSEHGVDKNRTGKSRRQQQREKQAARKTGGELCTAFVKGICSHPNCKYSHDVQLYIAAKQPDLPGTCPFIAGGKPECPHGVMCRYFGSHPFPVSAPTPASTPAADDAGAEGDASAPAKPPVVSKPQVSSEIAKEMAAKRLTVDGDGVLELPPPEKGAVLDEVNAFAGDLKVRLRKGKVRFDRADALLAELGVKSSWRYGNGGGGGKNKKDEGGDADSEWGNNSVEVGGGGGGGASGRDAGERGEEGGGKRRRAEDGSGIAVDNDDDDDDNKAEGVDVKLRFKEKKLIDFRGKLYLVGALA